jgi:transposase
VTSYLGLVPGEYSSGEQQRRGRVVRSAHPPVQALLVQAAWRMSRSTDPRTAALRAWAQGIARRRGQQIAMVALARRIARILFAMWRDEAAYDDARIRPRTVTASSVDGASRPTVTR